MENFATISFKDIPAELRAQYRTRRAARALVFDADGKLALLQVTKHNYHKLPGGGIKAGESDIQGLLRECIEEIGCEIKVGPAIGTVREYRDDIEVYQESVCYLATVVGEKGEPDFTQKEIDKGFEIVWVKPDEAIEILENDQPNDYEGPFIQRRDLLFLKHGIEKKSSIYPSS